jgi:hypothetical protein
MRSEVTPNLENERLRSENAALRSALKATNRITAPYADDPQRPAAAALIQCVQNQFRCFSPA